ncbi:metalloregulator ArsR/SmtB family transcription factor [Oxalobacter sp. OttesenSCG-928-P03]|nr:metalloregulator ArsR/SmtB family transcription factor [Oxalobacter sp. OttesenSCG-928-P03]
MRTEYINRLPEDWLPTARVFSALGEATRQQILLLFEPGEELSIKDISAMFSMGRSTIVHHLSVLQEAGIVAVRRQGRQALYSICYEPLLESLEKLRLYIESDLDILTEKNATR